MITLTTPATINSVLGGTAPVAYDKLVLSPFTMTPVSGDVGGTLRLTSTTNADMQPIVGTLRIAANEMIVEVSQLDFYRRVTLTGTQRTNVTNIIASAQTSLENGLVSLGVIAGVQTAGA